MTVSELLLPCLKECGASVPPVVLGDATFRMMCPACTAAADAADAEQEAVRRRGVLLGRVQIGPRYRSLSLATYPKDPSASRALAAAKTWLTEFRGGSRADLILIGKAGVGKTGLAWGLVRELIETDLVEADLVNVRDLLAAVRTSYAEGKKGDPTRRLRELPVLCLDDIGAERPTEWALEELAGIVEARYQWNRATIWTSNYRMDELVERFGRDDPVVGERIVSRMVDGAMQVKVEGRDRRLR